MARRSVGPALSALRAAAERSAKSDTGKRDAHPALYRGIQQSDEAARVAPTRSHSSVVNTRSRLATRTRENFGVPAVVCRHGSNSTQRRAGFGPRLRGWLLFLTTDHISQVAD